MKKNKIIYNLALAFLSFVNHSAFCKSWLIFYADNSTLTGHAFISFVKEDATLQQTTLVGCWGFYPKSGVGLWGEVEGQIRNDIARQKDAGFMFEVSPTEFNTCLSKKNEWESRRYSLTSNNCVDFMNDVGQQIPRLKLPQSGLWLPIDYVNTLKSLNSTHNTPCLGHPDVIDDYSSSKPNYHFYNVNNEICDLTQYPCCTTEFVFKIMSSNASFIAPYAGNQSVIDCGVIDVPVFGSIVTKINAPLSITNYTKSNHLLYNGKVTRYVTKVGNKIMLYTVGVGNNASQWKSWINKAQLPYDIYSAPKFIWNGVDEKLKEEVIKQLKKNSGCSDSDVTLFLFDTSGSMAEKNKTQQAKNAGISAINSIKKNNKPHDINIMSFAGGCSNNCVTGYFQDYTTDYDAAQTAIVNRINPPNGGTPLPQAIQVAEDNLKQYLVSKSLKKGRLIVMTDGESSCGPLRPDQVFQNGQYQKTVTAGQGLSPQVQFFTVGFDIPAGSAAERDLQYLASISGGKYFSAQNEAELISAFQKATKRYTPKPNPSTENMPVESVTNFSVGVEFINTEQYKEALDTFKNFAKAFPNDCHGAYNLALMYEASDRYKSAIQNYEKYLNLCAFPSDRDEVLTQIVNLKKDYQSFVAFNKGIILSDMAYVKLHFEKIQNGESVALAREFIGFIKEKYDYYTLFSSIVETDDKVVKDLTKSIAKGLLSCAKAIKKYPKSWDIEASPEISSIYLDLKDLTKVF